MMFYDLETLVNIIVPEKIIGNKMIYISVTLISFIPFFYLHGCLPTSYVTCTMRARVSIYSLPIVILTNSWSKLYLYRKFTQFILCTRKNVHKTH